MLEYLDQTQLPDVEHFQRCPSYKEAAKAIETLQVRGAPLIGIFAAYAVIAHIYTLIEAEHAISLDEVLLVTERLRNTRPTAVNLFVCLERMESAARKICRKNADKETCYEYLYRTARDLLEEDLAASLAMGEHGAALLKPGSRVLTHCNAGGLATGGNGTALAVLYRAAEQGLLREVYVDETRPLLQGSRLTAWELHKNGIPVTVIVDSAAAATLKCREIDMVVVGADRIAENGDAANKIGTLGLALAAAHAGVPLYVAAPLTTFDHKLPGGNDIPIEERSAGEVVHFLGTKSAPEGVNAFNPAFDCTPASLISGYICEAGVLKPPFSEKRLQQLAGQRPREVDINTTQGYERRED